MQKLNSIKDATSSNKMCVKQKEKFIEEEIVVEAPTLCESKVNIFQTAVYENENPVQIQHHEAHTKLSEAERLEIVAK